MNRPGGDRSLSSNERVHPLAIDRIVEDIRAVFTGAGAGKVEAEISDRGMRLVVNEEMGKAFAALGDAVARGALVRIHGSLARIETGETDGDKGCALLSVSVTAGHVATKRVVRDALSAMKGVIKKQGGSLRFRERDGEVRLSIYLPLVHSP